MKKVTVFLFLNALFIMFFSVKAQVFTGTDDVKVSDVKDAYIKIVQKYADIENNEEWGISDDWYFLFDITGDELPELWIITGTCEADYTLKVYTYRGGMDRIIFETGAGHSSFYAGDNYILRVMAHMGWAEWTKFYYTGNKIDEKVIFEENLYDEDYNETKENYTEPKEEHILPNEISDVREIEKVFEMLELKELMRAKERAALMSRKNYPDDCVVQVMDPSTVSFKWLYGTWYNQRENRYIVITPKHLSEGEKITNLFHSRLLRLTNITNHPNLPDFIIINDGDSLNLYVDALKQILYSEIASENGEEAQINNWERKNTYAEIITRIVCILVGILLGISAIIVGIVLLVKRSRGSKQPKTEKSTKANAKLALDKRVKESQTHESRENIVEKPQPTIVFNQQTRPNTQLSHPNQKNVQEPQQTNVVKQRPQPPKTNNTTSIGQAIQRPVSAERPQSKEAPKIAKNVESVKNAMSTFKKTAKELVNKTTTLSTRNKQTIPPDSEKGDLEDRKLSAKDKLTGMAKSAVTGAVGIYNKTIENISQWDSTVVRTHPLQLPENISNNVVYQGRGMGTYNGKTNNSKGKIVLTRKSLFFYKVPFLRSLLPGRHKATNLVFSIDLADIESISKETGKLGAYNYTIIANGQECSIAFGNNDAKWFHYITVLAGLEGSLLNIKLHDNEKPLDAADGKCKTNDGLVWKPATIYITNQRLIVNKGSSDRYECPTLVFDSALNTIHILESSGAFNNEYTISGDNKQSINIKFSGIVPAWFTRLDSSLMGNKDAVHRKQKLLQGARIAMMAAALLGMADDADAGDMDVDVDDDVDFDMDIDGDGINDSFALDTDGDGFADSIAMDTDGDGFVDSLAADTDGDGYLDTAVMDTDGDGYVDAIAADTDGDGYMDTLAADTDGDGYADSIAADTDGDGYMDTLAADTNGDGYVDTITTDSDGDGYMDTLAVDTNGDGYVDTLAADTDGDGRLDMWGKDSTGNGQLDTWGADLNGDGKTDIVSRDFDGDGKADINTLV